MSGSSKRSVQVLSPPLSAQMELEYSAEVEIQEAGAVCPSLQGSPGGHAPFPRNQLPEKHRSAGSHEML